MIMATTPYITVNDANTYFSEKIDVPVWSMSSDVDKLIALKQATRAINLLNFAGKPTTLTQVNAFPRNDEETPEDILIACCEEAYALLNGRDPEAEHRNMSVISQGYANVRSARDKSLFQAYIAYGLMSSIAWRYLVPYLANSKSLNVVRV